MKSRNSLLYVLSLLSLLLGSALWSPHSLASGASNPNNNPPRGETGPGMVFWGSYRGCLTGYRHGDSHMDIMFRSLKSSGREGSFLALLMRSKEEGIPFSGPNVRADAIYLYRVDPAGPQRYDMTPLGVNSDGGIGPDVDKTDPSLVIQIKGRTSKGRVAFSIASANSPNKMGFQEPMDFLGAEESPLTWTQLRPGDYHRLEDNHKVLSVSDEDQDHKAGGDLFGSAYIFEQLMQFVFTLKASSDRATGTELEERPGKIAFTLQNGGDQFFYVIDTDDWSKILSLRKL